MGQPKWTKNFFGPKNLFGPKFFGPIWPWNFLGPNISLGPQIFRTQIIFLTQNLFWPNFFWTTILLTFFGQPIFFQTKNFVHTKLFFGPSFFSDPNFFLTQNYFGSKLFLGPQFFWTQNFYLPKNNFPRNIFLGPKLIFELQFLQALLVEQGLTVCWFSVCLCVCVSEIISRPLIGRKLATSQVIVLRS